jgi:6-phosphogluconolactonase
MPEIQTLTTPADVANAAVLDAIATLQIAIEERGQAIWVLAGGSSPMVAYRQLVEEYADMLDWSKVTILIGDERLVPIDDPDSNWAQISAVLLSGGPTAATTQLRPETELSADEAARRYETALRNLSCNEDGVPLFDLVWLGVGEDGHTLSLFPGHPDFTSTEQLVIPVYNSPKPPATRITLTLRALEATSRAIIFAVGGGKKAALAEALEHGQLPIAQAAARIEQRDGYVTWLFDQAASTSDTAA